MYVIDFATVLYYISTSCPSHILSGKTESPNLIFCFEEGRKRNSKINWKAVCHIWFVSWLHCKQALQFLFINVSLSIVEYNCTMKLLLSLLFIENLSMPDLKVHNSVTYDLTTEVTCKSHNSVTIKLKSCVNAIETNYNFFTSTSNAF